MNLYLIFRPDADRCDYDTFDAAVVAAPDEEAARNILPVMNLEPDRVAQFKSSAFCYGWADSPDQVAVKLLGVATKGTEAGCICASYNAG